MLPASPNTHADAASTLGAGRAGLVCPGVDGVDFERGEDGVWRYAGTGAQIPGAVDVTLGDVVTARQVARPGREPEAVLVSLTEIIEDPRLSWALEKGKRLSGGDDELFFIAWPTWQEHVGDPVGVHAPERDADGLDRMIAKRERDVRLRRHELERATEARQVMVGVASGLGITRRHVAELIGVSTGRIQQLIDDVPRRVQLEVERILRDGPVILKMIPAEPIERDAIDTPKDWDRLQVSEMLDRLVSLGLLSADESARSVRRSQAGEQALKHLSARPRRRVGASVERRSTT
jgi:hypothetical protein